MRKGEKSLDAFFLMWRKEVRKIGRLSLEYEERIYIEDSLGKGKKVVEIAYELNRSVATIYRELQRGFTGEYDWYQNRVYSAELGQKTYKMNKRNCGRKVNKVKNE